MKYTDPDGREEVRTDDWWKQNWFSQWWSKPGNRQGVDLNLLPDNKESQFTRAKSHVSPQGAFIVAGHGNKQGVWVYSGYKKDSTNRGIPALLSAKALASKIKNSSTWEKSNKTVYLWACNLSPEYCQEVVNELGEGSVLFAPDGSITIGWVNQPNIIKKEDGTQGKMVKYKYQKQEIKDE